MGCCHSRNLVQNSVMKSQINLGLYPEAEALEILKQKAQESFESFKSNIESKLKPDYPLGINEIERVFRNTIHSTLKDFDSTFPLALFQTKLKTDQTLYKKYLNSKCKAEEGYFRYLNDKFSCKYIFRLQKLLISDFLSGKYSKKEAMERFKKQARGTFMISGLKRFCEIFQGQPEEKIIEDLAEQEKIHLISLDGNKNQLDRASRKVLMPFEEYLEIAIKDGLQVNETLFNYQRSESEMVEEVVKNASFSLC